MIDNHGGAAAGATSVPLDLKLGSATFAELVEASRLATERPWR